MPKDKSTDEAVDPRCKVILHFQVIFEEDGETMTEGMDAPIEYVGVPYYGAVAMQVRMNELLGKLTEFGRIKAEAMGQGDKLRMLLGEKK